MAEGYALGKKLPVNCNVFSKSNTSNLNHTIPSVVPQESNTFHQIPTYLNTGCLPFTQQYYSLESLDHSRYSTKQRPFVALATYQSILQDQEYESFAVNYA
mmetsp:Transcript_27432/g.26499  ORF Transcript_27432/g.26499 Transcript_27432/m.26499 type:complete len:101 (+) Transcript_27432:703-1005(+)